VASIGSLPVAAWEALRLRRRLRDPARTPLSSGTLGPRPSRCRALFRRVVLRVRWWSPGRTPRLRDVRRCSACLAFDLETSPQEEETFGVGLDGLSSAFTGTPRRGWCPLPARVAPGQRVHLPSRAPPQTRCPAWCRDRETCERRYVREPAGGRSTLAVARVPYGSHSMARATRAVGAACAVTCPRVASASGGLGHRMERLLRAPGHLRGPLASGARPDRSRPRFSP
jgi:hypothetical protein